jgi:ABC-2 type transport system permease protein
MRAYWTLVRRELGGHFFSWAGYVVIAVILFLVGLISLLLLYPLNGVAIDQPLTSVFYSTWYLWLILMLATPVITMRSFALEKFSGTYETLMTTPVSDWQVVMAKFSGALAFYALMCLPLLSWFFLARPFTNDTTVLDSGTICSTFLGIMLWGSVCISVGCLASAITRSQIIAFIISLASVLSLFLLSYLSTFFTSQTGWQAQLAAHLKLTEHMQDFARGVVDTRPVIFYLSFTVLFLFLTLKVVESRRWK